MADSKLAKEQVAHDDTGKRFVKAALGLKSASRAMRLPQLNYANRSFSTISMEEVSPGRFQQYS